MVILGIDTSSKQSSVCVLKDDITVYTAVEATGATHSQNLMPLIDSALKICGLKPGDIDLYAVTLGPGSFTGIRIGIAAVKGMASYKNTPCVGVSSLKALAKSIDTDGIIIPAFDARRRQVYACAMDGDKILMDDFNRDVSRLKDTVNTADKKIIFVGDGRPLCYNEFKDNPLVSVSGVDMPCIALGVAKLAARQHKLGNTVTHFELSPVYLRLAQAERELMERKVKDK